MKSARHKWELTYHGREQRRLACPDWSHNRYEFARLDFELEDDTTEFPEKTLRRRGEHWGTSMLPRVTLLLKVEDDSTPPSLSSVKLASEMSVGFIAVGHRNDASVNYENSEPQVIIFTRVD